MSYEAKGKIIKIFDIESKTASFQARDFVIEVGDGNYPQMVKFQLTQDRCSLIDRYKEGETVNVSFDLRGREWNGKYFTNLNAWKIDGVQNSPTATNMDADQSFPTEAPPEAPEADNNADNPFDNLPF